ncbi:MAG: hypothetical protein ACO3UM_15500, partial [Planctomycetota bacterium]
MIRWSPVALATALLAPASAQDAASTLGGLLQRAAASGERLTPSARSRLTSAGALAADAAMPLPLAVDAWLTSGWVVWREVGAEGDAR